MDHAAVLLGAALDRVAPPDIHRYDHERPQLAYLREPRKLRWGT